MRPTRAVVDLHLRMIRQRRDAAGVDPFDQVHRPAEQRRDAGARIVDPDVLDRVDVAAVAAPVVRVPLGDGPNPGLVRVEHERAGADPLGEVRLFGPDAEAQVGHQRRDVGVPIGEADRDLVLVGGLDVGDRRDQRAHHRLGACAAMVIERVDDVRCGEFFAVVEVHAAAQLEHPLSCAGAAVPAFGERRPHVQMLVNDGQLVIHLRADELNLGHPSSGIERIGAAETGHPDQQVPAAFRNLGLRRHGQGRRDAG